MVAATNASLVGIQTIGTYGSDIGANLNQLLALIPDPDSARNAPGGTGAVAGASQSPVGAGFLDEMSPGAAAQLRVELFAMGAGNSAAQDFASGEYTITADDATANLVDIVTGMTDLVLNQCAISVWNGSTLATSDAVITEPTPGTIRVADGSTYNTVAGYRIVWMAQRA